MSPRYDNEWVARMLDVEGRLGKLIPEELLVSTGLALHQTVVDVGCGPGFFTLPAAVIVGDLGRVYAVDIEQRMLDLVNSYAAKLGLENVLTVYSRGGRAPLPDQIADYAICSLLIHDQPDHAGRVNMVKDIRRLLRKDGRLLVIEWTPQPDDDPARRLTADEMVAVLRDAGLEFDDPQPLGEKQYMLVARAPVPKEATASSPAREGQESPRI